MTIKHCVFFQLKTDSALSTAVTAAKKSVLAMQTKCVRPDSHTPYILSLVEGPNVSIEDARKHYNWGFIAEFESLQDLTYYVEVDPVHEAVKKELSVVFEDVFVYDIEC